VHPVAGGAVGGFRHPVLDGDPVERIHVGGEPFFGRAYREEIPSLSWQPEHVFGMFRELTDEDGSLALEIVCSPCNPCTPGTPRSRRASPSVDALLVLFEMPEWHFPHRVGMFCRKVADLGSSPGRMVWLPWQSEHTALPVRPPFSTPSRGRSARRRSSPSGPAGCTSAHGLVLVAPQAGRHDVEAEGPRRGILRLPDVVLPVAVVARGDVRDAFARTFPWELMAYDFAASPWHLPQSTFASFSCGAFASAWQVTQDPVPWSEERYACRST